MQQQVSIERLSLIPTLWSLVRLAHHGRAEAAQSAQRQLLERYQGAIYRYLRKLLHDPDGVHEVFQEFALQLVQGKLGGADPQRGRFRNFVKGTLFHLVADYRDRQRKWPGPLPVDGAALAAQPGDRESERQFVDSWCDELLARAWVALGELEAKTSQPYYAVLRFRADHPEMRAPQIAEELTAQLGRTFTAVGIRQILHRAREKFAALLLDDVTHSLGHGLEIGPNAVAGPSAEQLEEELVELGLLDYCRPALERRGLSV
jgi:RNA polymerase sigma-70 factor (ECF subfamily)